jgi:hypothetical protein
MTMRWAEEKDVADMLERRRCSFYEWLYDDDTRLPTTMEILDIEMPSSFLNDTLPGGGELTFLERRRQVNAELAQNCQDELPPCIRHLPNLRSLSFGHEEGTGCAVVNVAPDGWGAKQFPRLRSLQLHGSAHALFATALGKLSLENLDINIDETAGGDWALHLHLLLAPSSPIRASLRVLHVNLGLHTAEFPVCLRGLQLKTLNLDASYRLASLPDWLSEMPLVYLGIGCTAVSRLPISLRQVKTLRMLCTRWSNLGADTCLYFVAPFYTLYY